MSPPQRRVSCRSGSTRGARGRGLCCWRRLSAAVAAAGLVLLPCRCFAAAASLPLLPVHPGLEAGELLVPCAEAVRSGRRCRQAWSCGPASAGTEVQWVEDSRVRRSMPQPRSDAPGGQLELACSTVSAGPTGLDAAAAVALGSGAGAPIVPVTTELGLGFRVGSRGGAPV